MLAQVSVIFANLYGLNETICSKILLLCGWFFRLSMPFTKASHTIVSEEQCIFIHKYNVIWRAIIKFMREKCVQYKNIEKNIKMKIEKGLFDTHK